MRVSHFAPALCALAFAAALGSAAFVSTPARADDPKDPSMRTAEARARDKAIIKKLNEDQLAYVRKRDAEYAKGWNAYREAQSGNHYEADQRAYEDAHRDYESAMASWRNDVAACRAGYYERCAR
ncbi:hypothetical protein [Novosphingobium album (ex Hu et al. 2023)]|uniref:Uncharacterized protein n=1 Tax=Novosphingobium album (ex Hu et al. 2023) TaxID=2930093 RepID=A0ABT0B1F6_9SPHN|nr:hypothetical protein [Novosphingobium album (ex Hu et al. 2023)]MCJ2178872.1 hypothetical protein [Novosphingobium album (ex Hu et al. 2023)]